MIGTLWHRLRSTLRVDNRKNKRKTHRWRPLLETLEDRTVPSCTGFVDLINKGPFERPVNPQTIVVGQLWFSFNDDGSLTIRTYTGNQDDFDAKLGLDDDVNPWATKSIVGANAGIIIEYGTNNYILPAAGDGEEAAGKYEFMIDNVTVSSTGTDAIGDFVEYRFHDVDAYKYFSFHFSGTGSNGEEDLSIIAFFEKCDNGGGGEFFSISGMKFYDLNVDGVNDGAANGEVGVDGWKIFLYLDDGDNVYEPDADDVLLNTVFTSGGGFYEFTTNSNNVALGAGTYWVAEATNVLHWVATTPTQQLVTLTTLDPTAENVDFGNVCLGEGGGLTMGFWSNRNGKRLFLSNDNGAAALALLNSLNLRDAGGAHKDFTSYDEFRTWLLGATATNMSYMLSAQLAAMSLNVWAGKVNGSALVYAPGCGNTGLDNNFITINDLIAAANSELGLHGSAFAGDAWRAYQECLKDALDDANNNKNFVQAQPCPVVYDEE